MFHCCIYGPRTQTWEPRLLLIGDIVTRSELTITNYFRGRHDEMECLDSIGIPISEISLPLQWNEDINLTTIHSVF